MIEVVTGDLAAAAAGAVIRPVAADGTAVTPAARRLEVAAGPAVAEQFGRLGELPVGSAVITTGGNLAAEYVVHVVVRSYDEPVTAEVVRRGLTNGLRRLEAWGIESVALPPLGTGAGNLDAEESAAVMIPVLVDHLRGTSRALHVRVVVETEYEREVFARVLRAVEGSATGGGSTADAGAPVTSGRSAAAEPALPAEMSESPSSHS
jgi:O-acetyl-ADP-ribose deacetylase (regulator of RNase III)